jgi:hypothetical protein
VTLRVTEQPIDTGTAAGKALYSVKPASMIISPL